MNHIVCYLYNMLKDEWTNRSIFRNKKKNSFNYDSIKTHKILAIVFNNHYNDDSSIIIIIKF